MLALNALRSDMAVTARDLLGLAWLIEQAARGCDLDGKDGWASDRRHEASRLRDGGQPVIGRKRSVTKIASPPPARGIG